MFNGIDLDGWIFRVGRYMALQHFNKKEKVAMTGIYMEGETFTLFHWADIKRVILIWEDWKLQLINRCRLTDVGFALEQHLALR